MERLNPSTGNPFKYGETREDGFIFIGYNRKKLKQDGTFIEVWTSPNQIKKKKEYDKKRCIRISKENRKWLNGLKVQKGCVCCGYKEYPEGLDFDHLHDKEFNIGRGGTLSRKKLEEEIKKCQVLCGTCHHIKTRNPKIFSELIKKRG